MFAKIINLTLLLVIQEIEEVLKDYPEHPYQIAFSVPELRNKLTLHVLNQLPNYYTILEDAEELPVDARFLYASKQEQVRLENLIRRSIVNLFRENADSISGYISQKDNPDNKSSRWFG
jgi:hypothetical protein